MSNGWNNLKEKVKNFFQGKKKEPETIKVEEPESNADRDKYLKNLEEKFKSTVDAITGISQNDETLIFTVNTHILDFSQTYYRGLGRLDGIIGSRDFHVLSTAGAHAERIVSLVASKVSGRVTELNGSIKRQDDKLQEQKGQCAERLKNLTEIEEEERHDDKSFNRIQGWMYVLFGMLMIISDMAVSLNLVNFFGIGNSMANDNKSIGLWSKITDGELLLFSLGIAFCTVYVKILYDDYVNTRAGSGIFIRKRLTDAGIPENELKKEFRFKGYVKVVILVGLLGFLFSLAQFRAFHTKDIISVHGNSTMGGSSDDKIGDAQDEKAAQITAQQKADEQDRYLLYSFIGLSLMVPLISGISLSVGFRIFQRRKMLKKAERIYDKTIEEKTKIENELKELVARHAEFSTFYKDWEDRPAKIKNMAIYFANVYTQAFREHYRIYNGNDLYVFIEDYRNEFINQTFSQALTKSSS